MRVCVCVCYLDNDPAFLPGINRINAKTLMRGGAVA